MDFPLLTVITGFQFQTGAIKRLLSMPANGGALSFNSKLVRLKAELSVVKQIDEVMFQFQTGAIKRMHLLLKSRCGSRVSIPNWCD